MKSIIKKIYQGTAGVLRYFWRSKRSKERIMALEAQQAFQERLDEANARTLKTVELFGRTLSEQVADLEELLLKVVAIQSGIAQTIEKDYKPSEGFKPLDDSGYKILNNLN